MDVKLEAGRQTVQDSVVGKGPMTAGLVVNFFSARGVVSSPRGSGWQPGGGAVERACLGSCL